MKRFVAVLAGLLTLPAFAEVAPILYEDVVEYEESGAGEESDMPVVTVVPNAKTNAALRAASRAVPGGKNSTAPARRAVARNVSTSRATRNGVVRARTAAAPAAASVSTRATRVALPAEGQIKSTRRTMQGGSSVARSAVTTNDTVSTPIYSGNPVARVALRSSAAPTSIRARIPSVTTTTSTTSVSAPADTVTSAAMSIDELAQLTDYCKAQYMQCMDNFCNVLDDEQGRCSCSANIKNYEKTEKGLKEAQAQLESVYREIMIVAENLTPDEIAAMFEETSAEAEMSGSSDTSSLYKEIQRVNSMLVEVEAGRASSTSTVSNNTVFDFDLNSILNMGTDSLSFNFSDMFTTTRESTNSISNQRGGQLYKTASSRCKTAVLNDCQAQGVDISVVSNSYDLEIDKQCIVYERSLEESNEEMINRINNAKYILKIARLYVAKSKNEYSLRDCVTEMDNCMQDDFVCGTDYDNCLDPTGKYIVNGEIVLGSKPGNVGSTSGVYQTWSYEKEGDGVERNAWADGGSLPEYIDTTPTGLYAYISDKIGTIDANGKPNGMCAYVMNHCQDYTYSGVGYSSDNKVIKEFMSRVFRQIKARQDAIVSEYAESCGDEVIRCLSDNGFVGAGSGSYSLSGIDQVAYKACQNKIITCASTAGETCAEEGGTGCATWANDLYKGI